MALSIEDAQGMTDREISRVEVVALDRIADSLERLAAVHAPMPMPNPLAVDAAQTHAIAQQAKRQFGEGGDLHDVAAT